MNNSRGVSLLEILIVIGIFAIVSAAVTSLSVKTIEHQRNQQTLSSQTTIYNRIIDDIRNDVRSAYAVWLSTDEANPSGTQAYMQAQDCSNPAPGSGNGNVLNIVKLISWDHNPVPASATSRFEYIRYEFITVGGVGYLVKLQSAPQDVAGAPSILWPKDTTAAAPYGSMPTFTSLAATTAPSKVYNMPGQSDEENSITGSFGSRYGQMYNPPVGGASTDCTYYLTTVDLTGLTITATGYQNKYDQIFGKANFVAPLTTFEIKSSIKFY